MASTTCPTCQSRNMVDVDDRDHPLIIMECLNCHSKIYRTEGFSIDPIKKLPSFYHWFGRGCRKLPRHRPCL
jgi:hypothetical protein